MARGYSSAAHLPVAARKRILSALAIALTQRYPQAADNGLIGLGKQPDRLCFVGGHHSLEKSLGLLGLGRKALRRIPVNEAAEIDVHALEQAIAADRSAGFEPLAIVGTAGTTSSGAVDSLRALAGCRRGNRISGSTSMVHSVRRWFFPISIAELWMASSWRIPSPSIRISGWRCRLLLEFC